MAALFYLAADRDEEIRREARKTLRNLTAEKLNNVVSSPGTHPGILDLLSRLHRENVSILSSIVRNPSTDGATIERIAGDACGKVLELIGRDIDRIRERPAILEAMKKNPACPPGLTEDVSARLEPRTMDDEQREEEGKKEVELPGEFIEEKEEDSAETKETPGMYAAILNMSVSEKIKLAITGNKEARGILVKDANRLVCGNVMKNPRLTESEVVLFSASKNVSEEVFRMIAANKDWIKNYQVKLNLVSNPRVPIPLALKFLNHIRDKDLELLSKSRNVSKAVSTMAKRILINRREKK